MLGYHYPLFRLVPSIRDRSQAPWFEISSPITSTPNQAKLRLMFLNILLNLPPCPFPSPLLFLSARGSEVCLSLLLRSTLLSPPNVPAASSRLSTSSHFLHSSPNRRVYMVVNSWKLSVASGDTHMPSSATMVRLIRY
jgi:hypothetical protein